MDQVRNRKRRIEIVDNVYITKLLISRESSRSRSAGVRGAENGREVTGQRKILLYWNSTV